MNFMGFNSLDNFIFLGTKKKVVVVTLEGGSFI